MSIRSTCLTFLIFQTFFVKCLSTTCDAKCQQKIMSNSLIDEERLTLIKQEILRKIDLIPSPVPALLNLRRSDTVIQSSKEAQNLMISVKKFMSNQQRPRRNRHNEECRKDSNTCCLDDFYVSFREIGLNHLILYPPGFNARACTGSGDRISSNSNNNRTMNTIGRQKINIADGNACCTPVNHTSLLLLIKHRDKITFKWFKNMIVTKCGCA